MRRAVPFLAVVACHVATPASTSTSSPISSPTSVAAAQMAPALAPEALAKLAEACFDEPDCALADATREFLAADEAGAPELDCFRFYYGTGVPEDLARARHCFDRNVGKASCGSSSPDLERLFLATMRLDGQGGPRDAEGARALLKDCFADVSTTGVLSARRTKGPLDFCRDIGGTTMSMQDCALVDAARATFDRQRNAKQLFASMDDAGKSRYRAATDAFTRYAELDAVRAGDKFRGGSLRPQAELQHRTRLAARRTKHLGDVGRARPVAHDLAQLEAKLAALRAKLRGGLDPEGAAAFDAADAAWETYRDAEIAFYTQSGDDVRADLVRDRIEALKD